MKYSSVEWTATVKPAVETAAKMFFAKVVLPDPGTARFMRTAFMSRDIISKNGKTIVTAK